MSFVKCDVLNEHTAKYQKSKQHLLEGLKAPAELEKWDWAQIAISPCENHA